MCGGLSCLSHNRNIIEVKRSNSKFRRVYASMESIIWSAMIGSFIACIWYDQEHFGVLIHFFQSEFKRSYFKLLQIAYTLSDIYIDWRDIPLSISRYPSLDHWELVEYVTNKSENNELFFIVKK